MVAAGMATPAGNAANGATSRYRVLPAVAPAASHGGRRDGPRTTPNTSVWTVAVITIPSGLYGGVASVANIPNRLCRTPTPAGVHALGGYDLSGAMLVNENPTGYQPR